MSDDKKPTLGRRPLGLKTSVEAGEVKQTFSHGRTNKVVVEVKRRKLMPRTPGEVAAASAPAEAPVAAPAAPAPQPVRAPAPPPPPRAASLETRQEMQTRLLREAEEARQQALEAANRREQEERLRALEEARRAAEARKAGEAEAAAPAEAQAAAPVEAPVAEALLPRLRLPLRLRRLSRPRLRQPKPKHPLLLLPNPRSPRRAVSPPWSRPSGLNRRRRSRRMPRVTRVRATAARPVSSRLPAR